MGPAFAPKLGLASFSAGAGAAAPSGTATGLGTCGYTLCSRAYFCRSWWRGRGRWSGAARFCTPAGGVHFLRRRRRRRSGRLCGLDWVPAATHFRCYRSRITCFGAGEARGSAGPVFVPQAVGPVFCIRLSWTSSRPPWTRHIFSAFLRRVLLSSSLVCCRRPVFKFKSLRTMIFLFLLPSHE